MTVVSADGDLGVVDELDQFAKTPFLAATMFGLGYIVTLAGHGTDLFFWLLGIHVLYYVARSCWNALMSDLVLAHKNGHRSVDEQYVAPSSRRVRHARRKLEEVVSRLRSDDPTLWAIANAPA